MGWDNDDAHERDHLPSSSLRLVHLSGWQVKSTGLIAGQNDPAGQDYGVVAVEQYLI